jgi:hypothetical protein
MKAAAAAAESAGSVPEGWNSSYAAPASLVLKALQSIPGTTQAGCDAVFKGSAERVYNLS